MEFTVEKAVFKHLKELTAHFHGSFDNHLTVLEKKKNIGRQIVNLQTKIYKFQYDTPTGNHGKK